jgi:hypothetical protein
MRFTTPTIRKLPKQAKAFPYKPKGSESLWKCWNCGFICNEDRDDHSGLTAGDNHTTIPQPAYGDSQMLVLDVPYFYHVIMEQDINGDKVIMHDHLTNITKGCPFCGTTNYKG